MIRTPLRRFEIMAGLKPRSQSGGRPAFDHRSFAWVTSPWCLKALVTNAATLIIRMAQHDRSG